MHLAILRSLVAASFVIACGSSTPEAKAPGTEPEDMTKAEHLEEAEKHDQEADEHKQMDEGKPGAGKGEHLEEAQEHRDVSEQHEDAAEKAE